TRNGEAVKQRQKILMASAALLIAVALGAWLFAGREKPPAVLLLSATPKAGALPMMWPAPAFELADQNRQTISAASLRGKVYIVDFIFTSCGGTCPRMTERRVELQKQITDPRVTFLSFSVDPERDDAPTRKKYAADHHVDEARWHFVAPPDRAAAMKLAEQMKIVGKPREHDNPILHADRFLLVDAAGRVRGMYHMDDAVAMQRIALDAMTLARNAPAVN
ncbi:MAG: SCO family protein, partial [Tepidisphaeraceae bacterium]